MNGLTSNLHVFFCGIAKELEGPGSNPYRDIKPNPLTERLLLILLQNYMESVSQYWEVLRKEGLILNFVLQDSWMEIIHELIRLEASGE